MKICKKLTLFLLLVAFFGGAVWPGELTEVSAAAMSLSVAGYEVSDGDTIVVPMNCTTWIQTDSKKYNNVVITDESIACLEAESGQSGEVIPLKRGKTKLTYTKGARQITITIQVVPKLNVSISNIQATGKKVSLKVKNKSAYAISIVGVEVPLIRKNQGGVFYYKTKESTLKSKKSITCQATTDYRNAKPAGIVVQYKNNYYIISVYEGVYDYFCCGRNSPLT